MVSLSPLSLTGSVLAALAFASSVTASPTATPPSSASLPLPYRTVVQFNETKWIENIAVRANGDLLVTAFYPAAELYYVSDPACAEPTIELLHNFTSVGGLLGIVETQPDVFLVVGGNFSSIGQQINGTGSAWSVDVRKRSGPEVKLVAQMTDADLLNGVISLSSCQSTVLIAESAKGLVWRLDTATGEYDVAVQVPEMAVAPGAPLAIGVNGIRIYEGYLYWTNTFVSTIYRVKVDRNGYMVRGAEVETVLKVDALGLDDFIFDREGNIWAATDLDGRLIVIEPRTGKSVVVEGAPDQLTLAGDTAAQWGRGRRDKHTLYVTTSGGLANPVNGTITEGGKVVAVDTRGFCF